MDPISLIITGIILAYKALDTFVFKPDQRRGNSKSIFTLTDFNRPKDKYGRAPQSIFTKLAGVNAFGPWYDKAIIYAGHNGEILQGYVDKNEGFNADSIFELWCFFVYWHGAQKATDIVFGKIINPMFNLGLKTVDNASTAHRFTAPDRRFFMLYDDIFRLRHIAESTEGIYNITIYTEKRKNAININSKNYAISLLNVLSNYPFSSGFFIDGLSTPQAIMNREAQILADLKALEPQTPAPAQNTNQAPPPAQNNSISNTAKSTSGSIIEKVLIGLVVAAILSLIFGIIHKFTKNGKK